MRRCGSPSRRVRWGKEGSMLESGVAAAAAAANGASVSGEGATTTTSNSYLEKLLPAPLANLTPC